MDCFEKEIDREYLYEGRILNLRKDKVMLPDGSVALREIVEHSGGVGVLAITDDGYVLLVEQYRRPYDCLTLEIPAGKLEKGEDPIIGGLRELSEETGYTAEKLVSLGTIYPSPGYCGEKIYIYLAQNIKEGEIHTDDGEFLSLRKIKLEKALEMIENDEICDSKTVVALLKYVKRGLIK